MIGTLAYGINTIVTAYAVAADAGVIKDCRHPAVRLMTVIALFV